MLDGGVRSVPASRRRHQNDYQAEKHDEIVEVLDAAQSTRRIEDATLAVAFLKLFTREILLNFRQATSELSERHQYTGTLKSGYKTNPTLPPADHAKPRPR